MMEKKVNIQAWWLPLVLVLGCLVFSYWGIVQEMVKQWLSNEDYSHGLLIIPIAAYLVWQRRSQLKAAEVRPDWRALPVLVFAIAVFLVGELGAELFTTRVSMLIFVVGVTWFLYGFQVLKLLCFPLAFLFLMLPLPGFIYRNLTFPLQIFSSIWSVKLLHILGVSAIREGNLIDIGFMQLQVVEACSGLRYILPLFTLGVLFAYFGQKVVWKRIVLVIATIPIAICANVLRVGGTGFIGVHWGSKAAEGFFHSFSGWVVFMLCIVFFGLVNALLKYLPGRTAKKQKTSTASIGSEDKGVIAWPSLLIAMAIILVTPFIVKYLGQVPPVPLHKPLASFPVALEGWRGERSDMDPQIWERVGGQYYVIIDYHKDNRTPVNFYVAYYEYQRKAGDFVHSPRLCLPGAGWYIEKNHVRHLSKDANKKTAGPVLKFNELVTSKSGTRQLVYFWYQGRGRNFTSEFAAKFYMVWDGLWRRRTDGALVRLIMPLSQGETLDEARYTMDHFALLLTHMLGDYLP